MLILRLSKREDQALIPISTILKFSALKIDKSYSDNGINEREFPGSGGKCAIVSECHVKFSIHIVPTFCASVVADKSK